MRGLIRAVFAFGAAGFVGIAIIARWSIAEPVHLGMQAGDVYRGAYLARSSGCIACHTNTAMGGAALAGGAPLDTPFGSFVPPNITPDPVNGIGNWTLDQFAVALRQGVRPDGKAYYPAFPYEFYADLSDQDVADLWAAFQSVPTVQGAAAESDISFPFNLRWGLKLWRAAYMSPVKISPVMGQSLMWNRGQELVTGVAHCAACHTGRNVLGGLKESEALAGNDNLPGGSKAPPIRGAELWAKGWTVANMAYALRTGIMPDGDVFGGSMAEVVHAGTSFLNDADRNAIATFLLNESDAPTAVDTPVADAGMAGMVHTSGMQMNDN
ncbi:c-type cytochrome [Pseudorhodobacter turbinis]|uniref:c-type cytochrome n=1 Tax=Pseudorhodobacter turbinis TaxID=2500533 RepID=UPI002690A74F